MNTQVQKIPQRRSLSVSDLATQPMSPRNTTGEVKMKGTWVPRGRLLLIATMAATFTALLLWFRVVIPWWQSTQDQWQYGTARITQLEANIGHGGVSHF